MRDREKYGIGEFRRPDDPAITPEISAKLLEVFSRDPLPSKEVTNRIADETGVNATKIRVRTRSVNS